MTRHFFIKINDCITDIKLYFVTMVDNWEIYQRSCFRTIEDKGRKVINNSILKNSLGGMNNVTSNNTWFDWSNAFTCTLRSFERSKTAIKMDLPARNTWTKKQKNSGYTIIIILKLLKIIHYWANYYNLLQYCNWIITSSL